VSGAPSPEQPQVQPDAPFNDAAFFAMQMGAGLGRKSVDVKAVNAETGEAVTLKHNPFTQPPPKPAPKPSELDYEKPDGTPSWSAFVSFILKHGDQINRARYPGPMGPVVDTIWQGVPVENYASAQLHHKVYGWVTWNDSQKGTE
jgi:hypothetical protein